MSSLIKSLQRSYTCSLCSSLVSRCSTVSVLMKRRFNIAVCSGSLSPNFSKFSFVRFEQISAQISLILGSTIILKDFSVRVLKIRSVVVLLNPTSLQKIKSIFSLLSACASLRESRTHFSESLSLQCHRVVQWVLMCSPLQVIITSMIVGRR